MIQYIILFIITFFIIMNIFELVSLMLLYFQYKRWIKYRNKFINKISVDYELINLRTFQTLIEARYEEFTRFNRKYADLISNLDKASLKLASDIDFIMEKTVWNYEPFNMITITLVIRSNFLSFEILKYNISLIKAFCKQLSVCTFIREYYYREPEEWMHHVRTLEKRLSEKSISNGGLIL